MSKVTGAYASLSRGVSQQPQAARLPGQHEEQVNMWTDPVYGLSRRRGTIFMGTNGRAAILQDRQSMTKAQWDEAQQYWACFRSIPWTAKGKELVVSYPTTPMPAWMDRQFGWPVPILVSEKTDVHPTAGSAAASAYLRLPTSPSAKTAAETLIYGGFSAGCQVGDYVFLYPNNKPFSYSAPVDYWLAPANNYAVVQIKRAAPNQTFSITVKMSDNSVYSVSYIPPSTAYPNTLDTSDIPYSDPEYTKKVNDRVNAYNSAVTAWITTSANANRPQEVARMLAAGTTVVPIAGSVTGAWPSDITALDNAGCLFLMATTNLRTITSVQASDGGSNESFAIAYKTAVEIADLPNRGLTGHIIQIRGKEGQPAYYVRAEPLDGSPDGFGLVKWAETARSYGSPPPFPFMILAVGSEAPTTIWAAAQPADLSPHVPGINLPAWSSRGKGDEDTSPQPNFYGKQITHMTTFQDRLVLAAGNVVNMSETSNYFQFWRTSTLTVPDSDPVEIYAVGSETDSIRHSTIFDKNLLLFGDKQQYTIDGRNPVTPATITIIQSGAVEDATDCQPVQGAGFVFFARGREASTEVFQMTPGAYEGSVDYQGLGQQIMDYIPGKPRQLLFVASPSTLFVRTDGDPYGLYVFRFIDVGNQRVMDSWSRFAYNPQFGQIVNMFWHNEYLVLVVLRDVLPVNVGTEEAPSYQMFYSKSSDFRWIVHEAQSMLPNLGDLPYLDSCRRFDFVLNQGTGGGANDCWNSPVWDLAVSKRNMTDYSPDGSLNAGAPTGMPYQTKYWLHGVSPAVWTDAAAQTAFADLPGLRRAGAYNTIWGSWPYLVLGIPFEASVTLTSPLRKDQNGLTIEGRLTVNRLDVSYHDTGAFSAEVTSRFGLAKAYSSFQWSEANTGYGTVTALKFNGQNLDINPGMVGIMPVVEGTTPVFIGRESKEYKCTIKAQSWMPLAMQRIAWTGQWFKTSRWV